MRHESRLVAPRAAHLRAQRAAFTRARGASTGPHGRARKLDGLRPTIRKRAQPQSALSRAGPRRHVRLSAGGARIRSSILLRRSKTLGSRRWHARCSRASRAVSSSGVNCRATPLSRGSTRTRVARPDPRSLSPRRRRLAAGEQVARRAFGPRQRCPRTLLGTSIPPRFAKTHLNGPSAATTPTPVLP